MTDAPNIVLFMTDHGDYAGDYGLQHKGAGLPECLVRVPLLVTGPGVDRQTAPLPEFVSLVDLMPTLCEAVGAPIPYGVQGRSLWPLLTGQSYPRDEFRSAYAELGFGGLPYGSDERPPLHYPYDGPTFDELNSVTQSGNLKMVRMDRWMLLYDLLGRGELYDLEADPGELQNVIDEPSYRDTRLALAEELLRWTIRTEDDLLDSQDHFTRALGLRAFQGEYGTEWNLLMAASLVVMLPVLLLFFFLQRYFIQGIVFTGIK